MPSAYCMKCRKKVEIRNPERIVFKNGVPALTGLCPISKTKVFRIVTRRMDPAYALKLAIEREGEANEFYLKAAEKTNEPMGKRMFKWLAKEEEGHKKGLERQLKSVMGKQSWLEWKEGSTPISAREFPSTSESSGSYEPTAGEVRALQHAIKAEKDAIALYRSNEEVTIDLAGKNMFASFARIEEGHLQLLEKQFEWISKRRRYFSLKRILDIFG